MVKLNLTRIIKATKENTLFGIISLHLILDITLFLQLKLKIAILFDIRLVNHSANFSIEKLYT